jgi:serine/threonine protein kinase
MTPLIQPHQWRVLEPLVDGALERDGAVRQEFLSALDAPIRAQVEAIVAECEKLSTVLEAPAVDRFAALIVEEREPPGVLGDRYHIERVLGRGGMATVYLADDARHSRKVAVKVLSADVAALVTRERFLREIRIAAQLTHPHILSVHDSGETDGHLFYVMPYVDGESLRHRLHRERRLPIADALAIASEVADALNYAHTRGVIHRDIKPENVLLEGGHAVVADFGIARAIDAATDAHARADGIATGTPAYMSPEQATGGDVDRRSDLYSLACVLHEMLAGEPPFTDPDPHVIVRHHLLTEPRSVAALRPDTPAWVAAAIERALAKRVDDRFAEVAQFVEALKPPTVPSSTVRSDTVPKPARLRRWSVAGAAAALSVLAAVMSIVSRQPSTSRATRVTPLTAGAGPAVKIDPRASAAYDNGVYYLARRTAEDRRRAVAELSSLASPPRMRASPTPMPRRATSGTRAPRPQRWHSPGRIHLSPSHSRSIP